MIKNKPWILPKLIGMTLRSNKSLFISVNKIFSLHWTIWQKDIYQNLSFLVKKHWTNKLTHIKSYETKDVRIFLLNLLRQQQELQHLFLPGQDNVDQPSYNDNEFSHQSSIYSKNSYYTSSYNRNSNNNRAYQAQMLRMMMIKTVPPARATKVQITQSSIGWSPTVTPVISLQVQTPSVPVTCCTFNLDSDWERKSNISCYVSLNWTVSGKKMNTTNRHDIQTQC